MGDFQTNYPILFHASWSDNECYFRGCVCIRFEDEDGNTSTPSDPPPKCLKLQSTSEACYVQVSCNHTPGSLISAVDVVCDARRMEVFGDTNNYITTVTGELVDLKDYDKVFMLSHSFDPPVKSFKTQLVSLVDASCVTMHGYHVTMSAQRTPANVQLFDAPTVDLAKVRGLLSEMGRDVPQGASNIMMAMDVAQKNRQSSLGPLQAAFSSLMGGAPAWSASPPSMLPGETAISNQSASKATPAAPITMSSMIQMLSSISCQSSMDTAGSQSASTSTAGTNPVDTLGPTQHTVADGTPASSPACKEQETREETSHNQSQSTHTGPSQPASSSAAGDSPLVSLQNDPALRLFAVYIEQRIQTLLRESEQRICSVLTDKIQQSEGRILTAIQGCTPQSSLPSCYTQPECD